MQMQGRSIVLTSAYIRVSRAAVVEVAPVAQVAEVEALVKW